MAVTLDTYDPVRDIHPRNKQIVGRRLAIGAARVAYGHKDYPQNGPFPTRFQQKKGQVLEVRYPLKPGITYDNSEISGFYVCCNKPFDLCDATGSRETSWAKLGKGSVKADLRSGLVTVSYGSQCGEGEEASGIAYLWEDNPVRAMLGAPIYSDDTFRLPAGPWKWQLKGVEEYNGLVM